MLYPALSDAKECPFPVRHVVVIWLKPDTQEGLTYYRSAIEPLQRLEGVTRYEVGNKVSTRHQKPHQAIDDTFDLIIDSEFCSIEDLDAFNKHPVFLDIALNQLKPIVDHYKVFDFTPAVILSH